VERFGKRFSPGCELLRTKQLSPLASGQGSSPGHDPHLVVTSSPLTSLCIGSALRRCKRARPSQGCCRQISASLPKRLFASIGAPLSFTAALLFPAFAYRDREVTDRLATRGVACLGVAAKRSDDQDFVQQLLSPSFAIRTTHRRTDDADRRGLVLGSDHAMVLLSTSFLEDLEPVRAQIVSLSRLTCSAILIPLSWLVSHSPVAFASWKGIRLGEESGTPLQERGPIIISA
jgi:hypothetical protein